VLSPSVFEYVNLLRYYLVLLSLYMAPQSRSWYFSEAPARLPWNDRDVMLVLVRLFLSVGVSLSPSTDVVWYLTLSC